MPMRYREDAGPETPTGGVTEDLTDLTAAYTLVVGIGLVAAGFRARLKWLFLLGIGLVLTGGGYLGAVFLA